MAVNRFAEQLRDEAAAASRTAVLPVGFAVLPVFVVQFQQQPTPQQQAFAGIQEIYRRAYEEAQAKARLTQIEKRFFSVWN